MGSKLVVTMLGLPQHPQHPPHHLPSQGLVIMEVIGCYSFLSSNTSPRTTPTGKTLKSDLWAGPREKAFQLPGLPFLPILEHSLGQETQRRWFSKPRVESGTEEWKVRGSLLQGGCHPPPPMRGVRRAPMCQRGRRSWERSSHSPLMLYDTSGSSLARGLDMIHFEKAPKDAVDRV